MESDALRKGLISLTDAYTGVDDDDDDWSLNDGSLLSVQNLLSCTAVNTITGGGNRDDDDDDDDDWKGWYNGCSYGSIEEAFRYAKDDSEALQLASYKPYEPNSVLLMSEECLNKAYGYDDDWNMDYYYYYYYSDDTFQTDDYNNDDRKYLCSIE